MKKLLGDPLFIRDARQSKKPGHGIFTELLIFIPVFFLILAVENIPIAVAYIIWLFTMDMNAMSSGNSFYFESSSFGIPDPITIFSLFITVLGAGIAVLYCRFIEERRLKSMGFRKSSCFTEYLLGGALGIIMISIPTVIGIVTGAYSISSGIPVFSIVILCLFGYVFQGMSEEIIFRGYLMTSMARKNSLFVSIILSSAVFSIIHFGNPGITPVAFLNLFLYGVVAAVLFIKRGSIWPACGMHTFWNFYQGNIFGINVSGTVKTGGTVFNATINRNLPDYLTGGIFGIEGSLYVTAVLIVFLLIFLFILPEKKNEQYVEPVPEEDFVEINDETEYNTTQQ